jgi:hypothetical protein
MTGSCLASCEWQTPLLIRFYLNISYGRFKVNFHLEEEAANRGSKTHLMDR